MEQQKRRKRLGGSFVPTERDRLILLTVFDYRFLTTTLLTALLAEAPAPGRRYGFGLAGVRDRCQVLREHGYLRAQFLRDRPTGRGYRDERGPVYSIGKQAIAYLVEHVGADKQWLQQSIERNTVSSFFLRHNLGIAQTRVCFELACRNTTGRIRMGTWLQDGLSDAVTVGDGNERIPVCPDFIASLIVQRSSGDTVHHFFGEVDMHTMPLKSIARKAHGYIEYFRRELFRRRYSYAGQTGTTPTLRYVAADWSRISEANRQTILSQSISGFQVLFITQATGTGAYRRETGKFPDRLRQQHLMTTIDRLDETRSAVTLFRFATAGLDFAVDDPTGILQPIWKTTCLKEPMVHLVARSTDED